MGHANKANRVRPADRSGDRGTRRVSAGRGQSRKSDGFLHFRRLHLRGALGAEDHHASEWLRWVWDQEEGEQPPEFASEKQAKRILSLLIGHASVLAFTLTHGPQYYEPRFYAHEIEGSSVPIVDEWCCGYLKGIALDPVGWQSLIHARPDWLEVIHLYGTKSGWERLKELVDAHEDSIARHQAFVDRITPAARNIHAYWLARRAPQEKLRRPVHKAPVPGRNDPCPCGSGKKFKHCHGAPDALH
jgi:uncharacterized protein